MADAKRVENALELLGRLGNPRDSESLRERLGDDAPLVRRRRPAVSSMAAAAT